MSRVKPVFLSVTALPVDPSLEEDTAIATIECDRSWLYR